MAGEASWHWLSVRSPSWDFTPVEALDFNWIKFTVRSDLSISIIEEVDLSSSKRAVIASVDHLNDDVSSPTSLGSSPRCRFLCSTYTNNHDSHKSPKLEFAEYATIK
jgi:hypothetical protein